MHHKEVEEDLSALVECLYFAKCFFFFSYLSYDHQNEPGNKVVPFIFYRWISQGSKSINNYLRTTLPIGQAFEFTQPDDKAYYLSWPY